MQRPSIINVAHDGFKIGEYTTLYFDCLHFLWGGLNTLQFCKAFSWCTMGSPSRPSLWRGNKHSLSEIAARTLHMIYIEDITRWREDMNFMFEWQDQYLTSERKAGIVTSLNDTTLTKVTYGKYATRVPDEVAYGIYEWFSSQ